MYRHSNLLEKLLQNPLVAWQRYIVRETNVRRYSARPMQRLKVFYPLACMRFFQHSVSPIEPKDQRFMHAGRINQLESMVAVIKRDKVSGDSLGTGRRKSSVARVRVKNGAGKITINDREFQEYFVNESERRLVLETLDHLGHRVKVDIFVRVNGGGTISQAGAIRMGLARAFVSLNEENFAALRADGFLTRVLEWRNERNTPSRCPTRSLILQAFIRIGIRTNQKTAAKNNGVFCKLFNRSRPQASSAGIVNAFRHCSGNPWYRIDIMPPTAAHRSPTG